MEVKDDRTAPRRIYCRVSTDQPATGGTCLDTQDARRRASCEQHGYHLTAAYRETYSGCELRRPPRDRNVNGAYYGRVWECDPWPLAR